MKEDAVIEHLMDIKERMSRVEEKIDSHVEMSAKRDAKLDAVESEVIKAKASLKTIRWISGLVLISVPATVAAVSKVLKG